jgi:hypothetical protein
MELDALKEKWAAYDRKLDTGIRLNRQLLLAANMNRVRTPLRRFAIFAGMGACMGLVVLAILGQFIYRHWAEPRFALPAAVLDVWVIAAVASSIRQMAMALEIDFYQPVATIQRQLESLRVLRLNATRWGLLTGQLVWWIPLLIVAFKGLWDVDAYRVLSGPFLLANLAFGLAVIPLTVWASRKFAHRMDRSPLIRRLLRDLAGYNLNAATGSLAELSEFEQETSGF